MLNDISCFECIFRTKRKHETADNIDEQILQTLKDQKTTLQDESLSFCISLVPVMQRLSTKKRAELKLKILHVTMWNFLNNFDSKFRLVD